MRDTLVELDRTIAGWIRSARRSPGSVALALALAAGLWAAYGDIVGSTLLDSAHYPEWHHCLLVPLGSLWIWYRRRSEIALAPAEHPWWLGGAAFFAVAVLLRLGELGLGGLYFGGTSIVFAVAAIVALTAGRSRFLKASWAVWFLLFAVPLPTTASAMLAFPLQQVAAVLTTVLCQAMGMPVQRDGVVLSMGSFSATIAQACSGMNSLFALLMCAVLVVVFSRTTAGQRAAMLLLVGPVVVVSNVLRLVTMMVVALFFGGQAALGFFHEGSDLLLFLILVSVVLQLRAYFEGGRAQPTSSRDRIVWVWERPGADDV